MTSYMDKSQQPILGNNTVDPETPKAGQWRAAMWKFLLFSALGIALFIIPFEWDGKVTILLGVLTDTLQTALGGFVTYITMALVTISFFWCAGSQSVKAKSE
ncbi:hypothetical protein [Psychrobacter sp. JCM 18900]|uniref:hypothetical protein n=1 Tax=Psychrobacter sp. JCM 18900 TaxID=1298608 RepID=UPI0021C4B1B5|nr:hypothetical protein [Psychrobacter sp. JCM 18900]